MNAITPILTGSTITDPRLVEIRDRIRSRGTQFLIQTGQDLIEAKAILPHGQFRPFLAELGISPATAHNYMTAAEVFGDKCSTVEHLPPTEIYRLARKIKDEAKGITRTKPAPMVQATIAPSPMIEAARPVLMIEDQRLAPAAAPMSLSDMIMNASDEEIEALDGEAIDRVGKDVSDARRYEKLKSIVECCNSAGRAESAMQILHSRADDIFFTDETSIEACELFIMATEARISSIETFVSIQRMRIYYMDDRNGDLEKAMEKNEKIISQLSKELAVAKAWQRRDVAIKEYNSAFEIFDAEEAMHAEETVETCLKFAEIAEIEILLAKKISETDLELGTSVTIAYGDTCSYWLTMQRKEYEAEYFTQIAADFETQAADARGKALALSEEPEADTLTPDEATILRNPKIKDTTAAKKLSRPVEWVRAQRLKLAA